MKSIKEQIWNCYELPVHYNPSDVPAFCWWPSETNDALMMFSLNDANFLLKRKVFFLIGKTLP